MKYIVTPKNNPDTFIEPETLYEWFWIRWKIFRRIVRQRRYYGRTVYTIKIKDREKFFKENCKKL